MVLYADFGLGLLFLRLVGNKILNGVSLEIVSNFFNVYFFSHFGIYEVPVKMQIMIQ